MKADLASLGVEALNTARRWVLTRVKVKQLLDSKSATAASVEKAKAEHGKEIENLERVMLQLEKHLAENGSRISASAKKSGGAAKTPFPWKSFLGMVAEGARAMETAVGQRSGSVAEVPLDDFVRAEVIDSKPAGKR